jgi:hypothetical protein
MRNLIPVESHVSDIPRRLREMTGDARIRVLWNPRTERYEVWTDDAAHRPYRLKEYAVLDGRVERDLDRAYWVARATGDPYKPILRHFDELDAKKDRDYWNRLFEAEYASKDILKYSDTSVVTPGVELS